MFWEKERSENDHPSWRLPASLPYILSKIISPKSETLWEYPQECEVWDARWNVSILPAPSFPESVNCDLVLKVVWLYLRCIFPRVKVFSGCKRHPRWGKSGKAGTGSSVLPHWAFGSHFTPWASVTFSLTGWYSLGALSTRWAWLTRTFGLDYLLTFEVWTIKKKKKEKKNQPKLWQEMESWKDEETQVLV